MDAVERVEAEPLWKTLLLPCEFHDGSAFVRLSTAEQALDEAAALIEELVDGLKNARATFDAIWQSETPWSETAGFAHEEIQHIDALLARLTSSDQPKDTAP